MKETERNWKISTEDVDNEAYCEMNKTPARFTTVHNTLEIISELDDIVQDESYKLQLEEARMSVADACTNVHREKVFDKHISQALGVATSVAVKHGEDNIAEDMLEMGEE